MENLSCYKDFYQASLARLHAKFGGVDENFPFAAYETLLAQKPPLSSYRFVSKKVAEFCHFLINMYTPETLDLYHRCLLLYLIVHRVQNQESDYYTPRIKDFFFAEYHRIAQEAAINPVGFFCYDNDLFCKDLAISTQEMFPIGAFKTEVTGIPRKILISGGWRQLARSLMVLIKIGNYKPIYELHFDIRYRAGFSPQGWNECFLLIAEMLEKNTVILGFTGASWFFDPQITQISPHLGYLRKLIEDNGGKFFFYKKDAHTTELALASSATRLKLYEQGLYMPSSFLAIWPRIQLIEWAEQHRDTNNSKRIVPATS